MSMMEAMGMIRCEDVLARLWDFLDGELDATEEAAIRRHLELCDRCYPQYDFQRAYLEYTRTIQGREQVPSELRRRLFRRLLEQDTSRDEGNRGS